VFLAALGADENQIEASFCAAIKIAREQKSVSLEKRAEGTYAEYRAQKAGALAGKVSDYLFANFKKKAKCARSSESLPTGLLCNRYNPECDGKSAIAGEFRFRAVTPI
jgi:DNA gyrase inhibitor GyrI